PCRFLYQCYSQHCSSANKSLNGMKKEIADRADIRLLVDTFYSRVREDKLLGGVFNGVIGDRWPEHLLKMYDFWETVLFAAPAYKGSPFPKHAKLSVSKVHFERW